MIRETVTVSMGGNQLLLLPTLPSEISETTLRAAYGPALADVLSRRAIGTETEPLCLDIAVVTDGSTASNSTGGSAGYERHQRVLAQLYRLIALLGIEEGLDLDTESHTDVRIVFVTEIKAEGGLGVTASDIRAIKGPLVPLETLSNSSRSWTKVYAPEGEAGEDLLQAFTTQRKSAKLYNKNPPVNVHRVPGGAVLRLAQPVPKSWEWQRHRSIAVGGTFDHLHLGHKLLLSATAILMDMSGTPASGRRSITVGITGDELLKNKKGADELESWDRRQAAVYRFLSGIISFDAEKQPKMERFADPGPNGRAVHYTLDESLTIKCVEISDPFGPTITDETITALVVSGETRAGGQAVNDRRREKQWEPLEVFEVDVLDADGASEAAQHSPKDWQSKISSTEIRRRLHERRAANQ